MIASIWGRESGGRMTYNAMKAAEISLAKSLAQQLAPHNIRVNSVAPGSILFPGGSWDRRQQAEPEVIADFVKRELPFGRFGRADEVGSVVAFLASLPRQLDQRRLHHRRRVPVDGRISDRFPLPASAAPDVTTSSCRHVPQPAPTPSAELPLDARRCPFRARRHPSRASAASP